MGTSAKIFFIYLMFFSPIFSQEKSSDFYNAFNSISKERLKDHIEVLGDDSLKGRGTGTVEGQMAAEYIRNHFSKIGLDPIINGSYFQNIQMHESIPQPESELKIFIDDTSFVLKLNEDYILLNSGEQTFIPAPLELVFSGYGIIAPEFDYNDYQSVDPAGKIVVMLEGEPKSDDPSYFNGELSTIYSYEEAKQRLAISRGAYGTIIIPSIKGNKFSWENKVKHFSRGKITLAFNPTNNFSIIINPETAAEIFIMAGISLDDIYLSHEKSSIKSFNIPMEISFKEVYKERDFIFSNVAGIIEGKKKLEDCIIISAHYDHLGIGDPINGDSIYNGVFDNAAGVAALLELSKSFYLLKDQIKRSIIFIALSGEENGLLGSTYYTYNPIVPLSKTAANINIDGISLFDKVKSFVVIGAEYSNLDDFALESAKEMGLNISETPPEFQSENNFFMSDQIAFAMAGIPSIITMEGINYENISYDAGIKNLINYSEKIYHTPFDDLSQRLNYDAALQHVQFLFTFLYNLAQSEESPEWESSSPFLNIRLQTKAEKR